MGTKLEKSLSKLSSSKRPLLMTHVVVGYPSLEESIELVQVMADAGAAFVELQIPFSDPIADGPTIMGACEEAIKRGTTPADCMKAIETLSSKVEIPLLFMSYYNMVLNFPNFVDSAKSAGCEGLIVPDISPGESKDSFFEECKHHKLPVVPLVSPVTSEERMGKIASHSKLAPFVYCVSTTGTTGARDKLPAELPQYLEKVKSNFNLPRALGFGISEPKHIDSLENHAEIAIVGSAVIDLIAKSKNPKKDLEAFILSLVG